MYEWLLEAEFAMLDFVYGLHNEFLDALMVFVTHLGDGGLIWIAFALLLTLKKDTRRAGVCMLLALLVNFAVTNLTLKPLVHRVRPFDVKPGADLLIAPPRDYSFPSGHTAASFAAATPVYLHSKKAGALMYALAFCIAFSRIYLYVHYPTDVVCAAVLGTGAGLFASWLTRRVAGC